MQTTMPWLLLRYNCSAQLKEHEGRAGHTHTRLDSRFDRQTKRIETNRIDSLSMFLSMYVWSGHDEWIYRQIVVTLMHLWLKFWYNVWKWNRDKDTCSTSTLSSIFNHTEILCAEFLLFECFTVRALYLHQSLIGWTFWTVILDF